MYHALKACIDLLMTVNFIKAEAQKENVFSVLHLKGAKKDEFSRQRRDSFESKLCKISRNMRKSNYK